jgi:hypothetical protein
MPINLILGLALGSPAVSSVGFQMPGSLLDLDLVNNLSYPAASVSSAVTFARASVAYEDDSSGVWSSFASGVMRRTSKGFLCEEVRTPAVRNSAVQGSVAGTPGTLPTNWAIGQLGTAVSSVVGSGTENGIDYVDIRLSGTTSVTPIVIYPEAVAQIAALNGQVWAPGAFVKMVGSGSMSNITNIGLASRQSAAGGGNLGFITGPTFTPASSSANLGASRQVGVTTLTNASTAFVVPCIFVNCSTGVLIDITLRIGWPQIEFAAFATSPMRTTSAAVQRLGDVATINDTASVALAGASLYLEWSMAAAAVGKVCTLWAAYVDANNYMALRIGTDNKVHFIVVNGGVTQADLVSTNVIAANTNYKAAVRWGSNDFAMRVTSSLGSPSNDVSGTPITGTPVIGLGQDGAGANQANAYIRRVAHLSTRTDAQLAAMVA